MPELPEVETIRRDLNKKVVQKRIKKIDVRKAKLARNGKDNFLESLTNKSFSKIDRRGKLLIFVISGTGRFLLTHLKMTGQLIYQKGNKKTAGGHGWPEIGKLPNSYSHIIFTFSDNSRLFFNDLRQFGYMEVVDEKQLSEVLARFGIEPLTKDFTEKNFAKALQGRKTAIKTALLNQQIVAGIGNIYADEVCFAAGIKCQRKVDSLTKTEIKKLFSTVKRIMKLAVEKRGTTFNNYRDADGNTGNFVGYLNVYHRDGKKCKKCSSIIKKTKLGGRGTHYCPSCQK